MFHIPEKYAHRRRHRSGIIFKQYQVWQFIPGSSLQAKCPFTSRRPVA